MLRMTDPAYTSRNGSMWRCILVLKRDCSKLRFGIDEKFACEPKNALFIPVLESRDKKHLYMSLAYRMRCTRFRRSSVNRGFCEHEIVAIKSAAELDSNVEIDSGEQTSRKIIIMMKWRMTSIYLLLLISPKEETVIRFKTSEEDSTL